MGVWAGCLRLGGCDSEQSNHDCLLRPCPAKHEHGYATSGLRKYQGGNTNRVASASVRGSAAWLSYPKRARFFSVSSGTVRRSAARFFHRKRARFSSSSGGTVRGISDAPAWKLGYGQFFNRCSNWCRGFRLERNASRGEVHETEGRRADNSNVEELAKFFHSRHAGGVVGFCRVCGHL